MVAKYHHHWVVSLVWASGFSLFCKRFMEEKRSGFGEWKRGSNHLVNTTVTSSLAPPLPAALCQIRRVRSRST